jgi:hypothetical protein
LRCRKTKQQLVDDNERAARIALYLPQLHAQKEKLEADLQELEHLALSGWGYAGCLDGCFQGYRGEAMQDLGYELPRIHIPRTPVNKGMKKGQGMEALARN